MFTGPFHQPCLIVCLYKAPFDQPPCIPGLLINPHAMRHTLSALNCSPLNVVWFPTQPRNGHPMNKRVNMKFQKTNKHFFVLLLFRRQTTTPIRERGQQNTTFFARPPKKRKKKKKHRKRGGVGVAGLALHRPCGWRPGPRDLRPEREHLFWSCDRFFSYESTIRCTKFTKLVNLVNSTVDSKERNTISRLKNQTLSVWIDWTTLSI